MKRPVIDTDEINTSILCQCKIICVVYTFLRVTLIKYRSYKRYRITIDVLKFDSIKV